MKLTMENEITFQKVQNLVCNALLLSEGLHGANNQMGDSQYCIASSGAFGLIADALTTVNEYLQELERDQTDICL